MGWIGTEGWGDCGNWAVNCLGFIKHGKFRDWLNDRLQVGFCFVESSLRKGSWFDLRRGITRLYVDKFCYTAVSVSRTATVVVWLANGEVGRIWKNAVVP